MVSFSVSATKPGARSPARFGAVVVLLQATGGASGLLLALDGSAFGASLGHVADEGTFEGAHLRHEGGGGVHSLHTHPPFLPSLRLGVQGVVVRKCGRGHL